MLVELHLDLPAQMTIAEGHDISDDVEARIKKAVPLVMSVLTHFDPIYINELAEHHPKVIKRQEVC